MLEIGARRSHLGAISKIFIEMINVITGSDVSLTSEGGVEAQPRVRPDLSIKHLA